MIQRINKIKSAGDRGLPALLKHLNLQILPLLMFLGMVGCTDFVEVEPPKDTLVAETVFDEASTVRSAMANLFFGMREQGMVSGSFGLTTALGIYADELDYYGFEVQNTEFYQHNLLAGNELVRQWWANGYELIYGANDIIRGVEESEALSEDEKALFTGQALFVRSFIHSLLAQLFGDVPYITTVDYQVNNTVSRAPEAEVFQAIITDLERSVALLEGMENPSSERTLPDQYAAKALLARMYLYVEDWANADDMASELIGVFDLEGDLERVFLKDSGETIWQLKPGEAPRNTQEANRLIIQAVPGQTYALTETFMDSFEEGDLREAAWTESISNADNTLTLFYAHKYKADFSQTESVEYSIVLRLAEQYLIRAEARAQLGNLSDAASDLNTLRNRAGLPDIPIGTQGELLEAVLQERRMELFTERGHRWFDLKRFGEASAVLEGIKLGWQDTDLLLPVPETEIEINPNLLPQNAGY